MSEPRTFQIFTAAGERFTVQGSTLRKALRGSGLDERKAAIVGAVDSACMPAQPAGQDQPFSVVFLGNPNFQPPSRDA